MRKAKIKEKGGLVVSIIVTWFPEQVPIYEDFIREDDIDKTKLPIEWDYKPKLIIQACKMLLEKLTISRPKLKP